MDMHEKDPCPYCGGSGQIRLKVPAENNFVRDRNGNLMEDYRYFTCFCINNKTVNKTFARLAGIPDITLEETIQAGKYAGFCNFLIYGNELKFLHLVKATMVLHANYHRTFEFLNGYELVQKYYVEQPKDEPRSLLDLEKKDMVILTFDATPENRAQNKVVFEVIRNRVRMNRPDHMAEGKRIERPTWLYARSEQAFKDSKEYSSDIEELIPNFRVLGMDKYKVDFPVGDVSNGKSRSKIQDKLGI